MGNAFMESAKKSKRKQESIEQGKAAAGGAELVSFNIRIPKEVHRAMQLHRIESGESGTKLINRLLWEELMR